MASEGFKYIESTMMIKDIGSIFSIKDTDQNKKANNGIFLRKDGYSYWALCREALLAIAEKHENSNKRILVPAYTCYSVIAPFKQLGWDIDYYNIKTNLRIDTDDLLTKARNRKPELCLFHPFFGCGYKSDERKAIEIVSALGVSLIQDKTQSLFLNQDIDAFDYTVASIRKWLQVPDGAVLLDKDSQISNEGLNAFEDYVSLQVDSMTLRGKYFESFDDSIKEESRKLNKIAELLIEGEIKKHAISQYAFKQLSIWDIDECLNRRIENYKFLFDNIIKANCVLERVDNQYENLFSAPLYFPVYLKNSRYVQNEMAKKHVYLPLLWRNNAEFAAGSKDATFIYEHIAAVPCDQRYNLNDMNRIVEELKEVTE